MTDSSSGLIIELADIHKLMVLLPISFNIILCGISFKGLQLRRIDSCENSGTSTIPFSMLLHFTFESAQLHKPNIKG